MRSALITIISVMAIALCGLPPAAVAQTSGGGHHKSTAGKTSTSTDVDTQGKTTSGTAASTTTASDPSSSGASTSGGSKTDPVEITSVSQAMLGRYLDKTIQATGIVGDHTATDLFNFHMDDGSDVNVRGQYPTQGHVTYSLTASVTRQDGRYVLSMHTLERKPENGSAGLGSNAPFIIAGVVLILAALATLGFMSMRGKADARSHEAEMRAQEAHQKMLQAQAEADRIKKEAEAKLAAGSPNRAHPRTVAAVNGPGAVPDKVPINKPGTLISIGSVKVVSGPHASQTFPLAAGETKIGRDNSKGCDVLLDRDREVSGLHGTLLARNDGKLIYTDSSRNGSLVNGIGVHQDKIEVQTGSKIEVGGSLLEVTLRNPSAGSAPPPSAPAPAAEWVKTAAGGRRADTVAVEAMPKGAAPATTASYGAELEVTGGPDAGRHFTITSPTTTLGREDVDLILSDGSISRKHATLDFRDGNFILTDNNSTHGTILNGQSIRGSSQPLSNGDQIALGSGKTVLTFHRVG